MTRAALTQKLTTRERRVLDLRAAGHTLKDVALALGIAESTVRCHLANAYTKLEAHNLVDALRAVGRLV